MFGYNLTHVVTNFIRAENEMYVYECEWNGNLWTKKNIYISFEIHSINENDNMRLSIYFLGRYFDLFQNKYIIL